MTLAPGVRFPAELFSRPIPKKIAKESFVLGDEEIRIPLVKAGFQDRLIVKLSGSYTVAVAAIVLRAGMPFDLCKRLTFEPQGYQKIHDAGGNNTHLLNIVSSRAPGATGFDRDPVGLDASTGVNRPRSVFPLALGAQTFELWYELPFTRSATDPTGALFIPHPKNTDLVFLPANAAGDVVTVGANLTVFAGTIEVWQIAFSRPPRDDTIIPFGRGKALAITFEDREDAIKTGDNEIEYPRGGKLLHAFHSVEIADAFNSADVDSITLDLDGVKVYDTLDRNIWDYLTLERNRKYALPLGVIHFNQDDFADYDGSAYKLAPDDRQAMALAPSQGRWLHLDSVDDKAMTVIAVKAAAAVTAADRIRSAYRRIRPVEVGV